MSDQTLEPWGSLYLLDWANLRSTSHSFTLNELSNYSAAGLDPYTVQVARAICPTFALSQHSIHRLTEVLTSIPVAVSSDSETANGRAMQQIVNNFTESESGLTLLGICGVVGEYYQDDAASKINEELARCTGMPAEMAPTKEAWKILYQMFSGLLSLTGFGALVDRYTQLGDQLDEAERTRLEHAGALGVISILQLLSRLSCGEGEEERLRTVAGKYAGWVAAVAEWLFDLGMAIRGGFGKGDKFLYPNYGHDEEALQLTIRFQNAGVPVDRPAIKDNPLVVRDRGMLAGGHMTET